MSKSLFLIQYEEQGFFDDTSEILEQVELDLDIYEELNKYLEKKEILESVDSIEQVGIDHIQNVNVGKIISTVLVPLFIRKSEEIDKNLIDNDTAKKILSLGVIVKSLELFILKRDKYKNNENILLMVG